MTVVKHESRAVEVGSKRKSEDDEPPYKVLFPDQRRVSGTSSGRYAWREFKDLMTFLECGSIKMKMDLVKMNLVKMKTKPRPDDKDTLPCPDIDVDDALVAKKFWRKRMKTVKRQVKNEAKVLKERDCSCAEEAIRFYNKKHDTDYEIVETLGSYCTLYIGFWFHCNFRARSKSGNGRGRHSSTKLFFAELYSKVADELIVNDCKMLDGRGLSLTVRGCEMCGDQLLHPANGFVAGRPETS